MKRIAGILIVLLFLLLLLLLLSASFVSAQTTIRVTDPSTGITTNVGDSANTAIRVVQAPGGPIWTFNWTQLLGAAPSATNPMPSRLTDGTTFIDPRSIRVLTSTDVVTVVQPTGSSLHTVVDSSALPTGASTSALQPPLSTTISGTMTNPGDFLQIATNGLAIVSGYATSSDYTNVYEFRGSADGTNYNYLLGPVQSQGTPDSNASVPQVGFRYLDTSRFSMSGATYPQFRIPTDGMTSVRMVRMTGTGVQTWRLVAAPGTPATSAVSLFGNDGYKATVTAANRLSVDASGTGPVNTDLSTIQGVASSTNTGSATNALRVAIANQPLTAGVQTTGVLTNPGDFLTLHVAGMGTLVGQAVTNDQTNSYVVDGSTDGTNFDHAAGPFLQPLSGNTSMLMQPTMQLNTSAWLGQVTPKFEISVAGFTDIHFRRVGGTGAQTWALGAAPASISNITTARITGSTGNMVFVNAGGEIPIDPTHFNAPTNLVLINGVAPTEKAASTAAVASDTALVVAVSPNNTPVLPSGASTSALQTTGNTSVASIDTKIPALGQATMANSSPVAIASNQSAIPVSGTVTATGPLTDTQLRATPVPVSGTVTTGGLTDTQLRASVVPVSLASTTVTGSVAVTNAGLSNIPPLGQALAAASTPVILPAATITTLTPPAAITGFALEAGHLATIDTSTARIPAQAAHGGLPIEGVASGVAVSVSQNASGSGSNAAAWWVKIGDVVNGPVAVKAAGTAATVPDPSLVVALSPNSNTVTANAGTNLNTSALALDATLTGRAQKTQITDGTRDGTVKAASTTPLLTDTALVTTQRDPLPAGTNVIGHVIADTGSTTAVTGTVAVTGPLTDTQLRATPVPISGTVTTTPPANASSNIAQVNGITTLTGTGATGTGSQRMTVAVDSATVAGSASLPAGTNVIGHVIQDTGSTTAVTGNVTVVQPTGTNLHAVLDSGTTVVTQPTGSNLHVACDSGCAAGSPGQATMAASSPVVIASNQSAFPITTESTDIASTVTVSAANAACLATNCASVTLNGAATAYVSLIGAFSGNILLEVETNSGVFNQATCYGTVGLGTSSNQIGVGSAFGSITGQSISLCSTAGQSVFRARATTYTSGTPTLTVRATKASAISTVFSPTAQNFNVQSRVTDGTNTANVKAASTAAVASDPALVVAVSPNNVVPTTVNTNGVVSTVNSSTAVLGAGAVFTGTSEDVTEYADIRVNVFSDQASATDGLSIQQSSNGTNWDITDVYTIPASTGKTFSIGTQAKFFRVVYTNGATLQGAFRLQTIFRKAYTRASSQRPQDARTNDNDFEETSAYLSGFNGTTWDRLRATTANGLAVDVTRVAGNVTVVQPTGTNLHAVLDTTSTTAVTQATAANLNATVTQQTLTKGTQGATGVSTQDLKDAGRTSLSFYANNVASGTTTTETIITLTQSSGTGATSSAASYTITNGKRLRITALSVGSRGNATATIQSTVFNLRMNTAAACTVTSTPILFAAQSATAAVASAWDRVIIPIPDGYEIAGNGTISICISAAATFTTNAPTWSVNLIGFEY